MSLKKYLACDPSHYNEFQYVCLKEKRVFCLKCWCKFQHFRICQSSRCGQYSKIAHLALNRSFQYKNGRLLQALCGSKQTYEQFRIRFLQLNCQITDMIRDFVEQKMPLVLWSMINQLLRNRVSTQQLRNFYKFDSLSTQMIRIIKSSEKDCTPQYLQKAITAYYDINHEIQGDMYLMKNGNSGRVNHKEPQITEVIEKIKENLNQMLGNIKKNIRKGIDDQITARTSKINPDVSFKGIVFQKLSENDTFRKREEYPFINLLAQQYSKVTNEQAQLYNGFHLNLPDLESNSQQLLSLSKCFLKDRLYSVYEGINTVKSTFPYRFAYPISTTMSQDEQYQDLILDLEKSALETAEKNGSPFLCTLNLVIIGRELIVVKLYNHPKFSYSLKIYNYKASRKGYYDKLIDKLGLKNVSQKSSATPTNIQFSEQLSDTELVYCHFRTAYQTIFFSYNQELVFEGQKVMANRGAEQFLHVIQKWRSTAQIELPFDRPVTEMISFFI